MVCLNLNGGTEYATPAKIPTAMYATTSSIPVIAPRPIEIAKSPKEIASPSFPRFFVNFARLGSDFSSSSASYTLFMASTPLHKKNAMIPKYTAFGRVELCAIRNVAPMFIMNSIIPRSKEMNDKNPLRLARIASK